MNADKIIFRRTSYLVFRASEIRSRAALQYEKGRLLLAGGILLIADLGSWKTVGI
jgi:hypothetical protein